MNLITRFTRPNFSYGKTELNPNIHQNFPFALQSYRNQYNYQSITMRVNPHANLEVLPLTLQSEIKQHQIISLIKGNC